MLSPIRAVGMVIYTYEILEERREALWAWLQQVEIWSGRQYAEFSFEPWSRKSIRVWKATPRNRENLYQRLQEEQPWCVLHLGWPRGALKSYEVQRLEVVIKSWTGLRRETGSRIPSHVYLKVHPDVLVESRGGVLGFLELGIRAWELIGGVYGFIDVETGVPLQDHLDRNVDRLYDSTVPPAYHREFRAWQDLESKLDRRVWKAFWGNFLGAEHLRQLGGIQALRRADPLYELKPEYLAQAYREGVERLRGSGAWVGWWELAGGGVLVTLSASPLEWGEAAVQARWQRLQALLRPISWEAEAE